MAEEEALTNEQIEMLNFFYKNSSNPNGDVTTYNKLLGVEETARESIFRILEAEYESYKDYPVGAVYEDGSINVRLFDDILETIFGDNGFLTTAEANNGVLTDEDVQAVINSDEYENNKLSEEISSSLTQPTLGTFDPERSRFTPEGTETGLPAEFGGSTETQIVYATPEEEALAALTADRDEVFIQQEVGQLIAALRLSNPKELELMAIELAHAGFYDGYGGYEGIFVDTGNELILDDRVFGAVMGEAMQSAMFAKPSGDIIESETAQGSRVHAAGQFGIGLSTVFDIITGQSGLSAQEIINMYDEGVAEERKEDITQYDPVYLAQAVNTESETLFGRSLTKPEKDAFVVFMVDLVKEHHKMNVQMPVVGAQAEAWLQERKPERTRAAQVGDAVSTLENIILRGAGRQ